ncbi:MAG TPA: MFS transporter [Terriglobales bacterium]|jgi:MFS family permease|nr:MFS transporter [Terriglobales bacterium]
MRRAAHPVAALTILTGLNFFNYVDRSVLFAVQPLVQNEFHRTDAEFGLLTTAFFFCYMFTAPLIGVLADRVQRRGIMVAGAIVWSAATLLTAATFDFRTLFIRHTVVGIGEATFVTIAPSFLADLFPEAKRGRVLGVFYLCIGLGTAVGYIVGGSVSKIHGWRAPFYVAAVPGFLLAAALAFIPEPARGMQDTLPETRERATVRGLVRNGAFWTATLGMAMWTFGVGALQVWMPTFLSRMRHEPLEKANLIFGGITAFNAVFATLLGGWIGDRFLRKNRGGYYIVSSITMLIALPVMLVAITSHGSWMYPSMFLTEFLLFLNMAPLNAAVVNSVGAHIRATAIAVNLFTIHLLGDAFSPTLVGYISDRSSLQTGFLAAIVAVGIASGILYYGKRFAPPIKIDEPQPAGAVL